MNIEDTPNKSLHWPLLAESSRSKPLDFCDLSDRYWQKRTLGNQPNPMRLRTTSARTATSPHTTMCTWRSIRIATQRQKGHLRIEVTL